MRISSVDALQRGLLNLRANVPLVGLQILQSLIVTVVSLAGLVPLVLAFGVGMLKAIWGTGAGGWRQAPNTELERLFERVMQEWPEQWPLLVAAFLAAGAVWTVAFFAYCWFQAGILGVLASGEHRASASTSPGWSEFRVFRRADFVALAHRRTWKLFWLINLYLVLGLVLVFVLLLALTVFALLAGGDAAGLGLLFALGCLTVLVLLVGGLVLYAASEVGKAELVVAEIGAWEAFRRSFATLWRRAGAVILLVVLFIVCSLAIGVVFLPVSLGLDLAMGESFSRQLAADVVLMLVQSVFSAAIVLGLSSSLVSLVKGER